MLPLLPLYISYFTADSDGEEQNKKKVFFRALAFVAGFSIVFCLLGLFAGTIGAFLKKYQVILNIVSGIIVIIFGLSYLEIIPLPFFKGMTRSHKATSVLSAFLFGAVGSTVSKPEELSAAINRFLSSLKPEDRFLFVRRYWYADSVEDLAAMTESTPNRVSVRLFRVRAKLYQKLEKEGFLA